MSNNFHDYVKARFTSLFFLRDMSWIIRLRSHVYVHEIKMFHFESGSKISTSEWMRARSWLSLINIVWWMGEICIGDEERRFDHERWGKTSQVFMDRTWNRRPFCCFIKNLFILFHPCVSSLTEIKLSTGEIGRHLQNIIEISRTCNIIHY